MDQHRLVLTAVIDDCSDPTHLGQIPYSDLCVRPYPHIWRWHQGFVLQHAGTIQTITTHDKLVMLGDLNGRVNSDRCLWNSILGHHGIGNCNANGQFLLGLCTEHELVIINNFVSLLDKKKNDQQNPRSKDWQILDYILTRSRNRRDVRSVPDADDC